MSLPEKPSPPNPAPGDAPGFPCPQCKTFRIKLTLEQVLYARNISCPGCGLEFTIDRSNSQELMGLLQQVHVATKNLEMLDKQSL